MTSPISQKILEKAASITGKRARIVVDVILQQGFITTEDLKDRGYDHPPRAIKDVTDQGLPLARSWVKRRDGRKIARYEFGDPADIRGDRLGGRRVFSKEFKENLILAHGGKCAICSARLASRYLQVDHRVPYEIAGDIQHNDPKAYMPLCGSCNRAKSWSCEHCDNWLKMKDPAKCRSCYWASPEAYSHVALVPIRRLDVTWNADEISDFEDTRKQANRNKVSLPEFVKHALRKITKGN